jgi:hypothetical protein
MKPLPFLALLLFILVAALFSLGWNYKIEAESSKRFELLSHQSVGTMRLLVIRDELTGDCYLVSKYTPPVSITCQ